MLYTCSEIVWPSHLLDELGFPQETSTPLHVDNASAIQIDANPIFHDQMKHIEVDCHYIWDPYDDKTITLRHVTADLQVADIFTKTIPHAKLVLC